MGLSETIFMFQFVIFFAILLTKIYNIMSLFLVKLPKKDKDINQTSAFQRAPISQTVETEAETQSRPLFPYDNRMSWLLLIIYFLMYFLGFNVMMINHDSLVFVQTFRIQSSIFILIILFQFIEIFMGLKNSVVKKIPMFQRLNIRTRR